MQVVDASLTDPDVRALLGGWGFNNLGGSTITEDDFEPPSGAFLVARDGPEMLGCAGIRYLTEGVAEVKRLYVAEAQRGRGIGRRLLAAVEQAATGLGYGSLVLDTDGSSHAAIALFRAAGFESVPDYNGNHLARYWFRKDW